MAMKKQQPSNDFKISRNRTSSTDNGNLLLDNENPGAEFLQCHLTPPSKRFKSEREDESGTNETVFFTSMHNLPNEILDKVFSYLSIKQRIEIEQVCKRWYWMGQEYKWQRPSCLSLSINRPLVATSAIEAILFRCGKSLKKLQLFNGRNNDEIRSCITRNAMEIIAHYCPNLEYFNIGAPRLPNLCLQTLAERCPKLKTVCLYHSTGYTENGLTDFLELCQNLECLDVRVPITGKCFSLLSSKLQILRVTSANLEPVGLENVMNRCQHLCELSMSRCLTPLHIMKMFLKKYKETLTILVLGEWLCNDLSNSVDFLQNVSPMVNYYRVDDELMDFLAQECRNLKDLTICYSRVTNLGLSYLASLPHLKILDISYNLGLGVGMEHVAKEGRLEELYGRCMPAQPNYFVELARLCPNLRVVDMSDNSRITNSVVIAFYESIKCGFLKGPLKLIVGNTGINIAAPQCKLLQLHFNTDPCCCRRCSALCDVNYSVVI